MEEQKDTGERNVFSQPWNGSDVVLVVQENEFHVHRYILSLQSPVFKAMFEGNFKDAQQDKNELKGDKYEAMLLFLQLLYPQNMLVEGGVSINDENILQILEVADKYAAINVIKQCMKETERIRPEISMRLLPYAARHELPLENFFSVIARHISTDKVETVSPELGDQSIYINTLLTKCRFQESVVQQAGATILYLLQKLVAAEQIAKNRNIQSLLTQSVECVPHKPLEVKNFKKARECENCLEAYRKHFIDEYVYQTSPWATFWSARDNTDKSDTRSVALIELLKDMDDIATSLQS